jgi:hypothetical protein
MYRVHMQQAAAADCQRKHDRRFQQPRRKITPERARRAVAKPPSAPRSDHRANRAQNRATYSWLHHCGSGDRSHQSAESQPRDGRAAGLAARRRGQPNAHLHAPPQRCEDDHREQLRRPERPALRRRRKVAQPCKPAKDRDRRQRATAGENAEKEIPLHRLKRSETKKKIAERRMLHSLLSDAFSDV